MKAEYMKLGVAAPGSPRHSTHADEDEERKALIAPEERHLDPDSDDHPSLDSDLGSPYDEEGSSKLQKQQRRATQRRRLTGIVLLLSLLLLGAALPVHRLVRLGTCDEAGTRRLKTEGLVSNGTHEFRKSALIVSIDGLRADYLDRGLTPHLLAISKDGLRAKSMKPVFPTLTFPYVTHISKTSVS
ncbi:hypothetical protein FKP32DRAFT_1173925 [Trametes sanguinea]|nr:hypothetical protein FKP32DRAFT_1173925 [Trametes sanguinea]